MGTSKRAKRPRRNDPFSTRLKKIVKKVADKKPDAGAKKKVPRALLADLKRLINDWIGPIVLVDSDGHVLFVNRTALRVYKAKRADVLGYPFVKDKRLKKHSEPVLWRDEEVALWIDATVEEGEPVPGAEVPHEEVDDLKRKLSETEAQASEMKEYFEQAKTRCSELETRYVSIERSEEEARTRAEELARRIAESQAELEKAMAKTAVSDRLLDRMEGAVEKANERVDQAHQRRAQAEASLKKATDLLERIEQERDQMEQAESRMREERDEARRQLEAVNRRSQAEKGEAQRELQQLKLEVVELRRSQTKVSESNDNAKGLEAKLTFAETQAKEANSKLFDAKRELERAEAKLKATEAQLRGASQRVTELEKLVSSGGGNSGSGGDPSDLQSYLRMKKRY